ncbi:MAG: hypothetical protein Q7T03_07530 [Deltaproteobacteria bacterium]|nr:hypothetical protein [Deltaproteobacteria bacterium]
MKTSFATLAMTLVMAMTPSAFSKPLGTGTVKFEIQNNNLVFDNFVINFQRTLRIPNDGKQYPLPPGLGSLPIYRVSDYAKKLPKAWVEEGGVFIPMYQREAMWISFENEVWRPRAVKIGIGKINVLTGEAWTPDLKVGKLQDYLVAPVPQQWIDGIKAGKDFIRQFVAVPLGKNLTVEGQLTGKETFGGLQIAVYNPKKGIFKKPSPKKENRKAGLGFGGMASTLSEKSEGAEMGLGAGGTMRQKIYPDPHGCDTWDPNKFGTISVHIVNSQQFEKITGQKPPDSPITEKDYELYSYPWFDLYDEKMGDLPAQEKLKKIKPVPGDDKPMKVKKTIKYDPPVSQ